jgi:hypothetical protein
MGNSEKPWQNITIIISKYGEINEDFLLLTFLYSLKTFAMPYITFIARKNNQCFDVEEGNPSNHKQ